MGGRRTPRLRGLPPHLGHVVDDERGLALDGGRALAQAADQQRDHDGQRRRLHRLRMQRRLSVAAAVDGKQAPADTQHRYEASACCDPGNRQHTAACADGSHRPAHATPAGTSRTARRSMPASAHGSDNAAAGDRGLPAGEARTAFATHTSLHARERETLRSTGGRPAGARACTKVVAPSLCTQSGTSAGRAMQETSTGMKGSMSRLPTTAHTSRMHLVPAVCGGQGSSRGKSGTCAHHTFTYSLTFHAKPAAFPACAKYCITPGAQRDSMMLQALMLKAAPLTTCLPLHGITCRCRKPQGASAPEPPKQPGW